MPSDETAAMLSFLRTLSDGAACDACLAAYLGAHRDSVLRSIWELIDARRIVCTYAACAICLEQRFVAHMRTEPPGRSHSRHARSRVRNVTC
jgi:hypothetical protein